MSHSGISGVLLASVYCYVTKKHTLFGAHDSLIDAKAQYKVVKDNRFRDYTDKAESLMDIRDVWRANHERVRVQAQKEEITRDVPTGWTEDLVDNPKIIDPDKDRLLTQTKITNLMLKVVSMGQQAQLLQRPLVSAWLISFCCFSN
jgi:hypothetical protein